MRVVVLLALLLSACATEFQPENVFNFDSSPVRDAWMAAGLPDPISCPTVRAAVVSDDEFLEACGHPTCFAGLNLECAWACVIGSESDAPIALYTGGIPPGGLSTHTDEHEQAHETFHVWSHCLFGDVDYPHTQRQIWDHAMAEFDAAAAY